MAFVFKSEREINPLKNITTGDLGPGQYLPQGSIRTNNRLSKVGFDSNTYRDLRISKNENPGPGSYEKDDKYEKFAELFNDKPYRSPSLLKSLELVGPENLDPFAIIINKEKSNKDVAFFSKEKRFKDYPHIDYTGPSDYGMNNPKLIVKNSMRKINKRQNQKGRRDNSILNRREKSASFRHISIPSKNLCYGFEENKNGNLIIRDDPDKEMRHDGNKSDCVGPGSYDINKENWNKGVIRWDKDRRSGRNAIYFNIENKENPRFEKINDFEEYMNKRDFQIRKNVSNNNSINITKRGNNFISEKNDDIFFNERNRLKKEKLFKHFIDKRQKLLDLKTSKSLIEDDLFEKHILNQEPGPGYYSSEIATSAFKPKKVPEKFQYFGSNSLRFNYSNNKIDEDEIGPGIYFKDDNKFGEEKNKSLLKEINYFLNSSNQREGKKKNRFENLEERIGINDIVNQYKYSNLENSPGPGFYDITPELHNKKSTSNVSKFGYLQKRFNENILNASPGPGSYIGLPRVDSLNIIKFNVRPKKIIIKNDITEEEPLLNKNKKLDNKDISSPGVGSYDSDIISSLSYNVAKNVNKFNTSSAPFNSVQKRFKNNSLSDASHLGPGKYYNDDSNKKILKNQLNNSPPFNIGSERKILNEKEFVVDNGPGSYNLSSYFDWNKKSFNVQFI
jgi:hypothetical protein